MKWTIKDYEGAKSKYPNLYRESTKSGGRYQVSSDYGNLSGMFKSKEDAISYAKSRNKTKSFKVSEFKW